MRSSRRGGGRRADHPFPLVPRDPENLDRDPETLKRQTAYLASALNDPTELNALHAARASAATVGRDATTYDRVGKDG